VRKDRKKVAPPVRKHGRRLHDNGSNGAIAMTIEDIKQTELTLSERDVLKADAERWARMGAGGHLDDWLAYAPGLMIRRRLAMKIAYTDNPKGRGYNEAYSELLRADGINIHDKSAMTAFTAVQWLWDSPENMRILREIRDAMTPGERSRLNSPISARQRVEKILQARAKGTEEKLRESPVKALRKQIAEKDRRIAELEAKLARTEEGSLFDLRNDTADDIGRVVADSVTEHRAEEIAKAIRTHCKRKKQTPAE
jgi:hypothetical protein